MLENVNIDCNNWRLLKKLATYVGNNGVPLRPILSMVSTSQYHIASRNVKASMAIFQTQDIQRYFQISLSS